MQPFPDEVKLSHTAILHSQLTEVPSRASHACVASFDYDSNCILPRQLHADANFYHDNFDKDDQHNITKKYLIFIPAQIVKQSAAINPSTVMRSDQSSPSVPAAASTSVPAQQPSPAQSISAVKSGSVSSSPQVPATVQPSPGSSPQTSLQAAPVVQQVVPQYSPVDGQDQYGR